MWTRRRTAQPAPLGADDLAHVAPHEHDELRPIVLLGLVLGENEEGEEAIDRTHDRNLPREILPYKFPWLRT